MKADIIAQLKKEPVIKTLSNAVNATDVRAYLVGGVLRNVFLSHPVGFDYDIVLGGKVRETATFIARSLKGSFFLLDKRLGSYRVIIRGNGGVFNIDLSLLKGGNIRGDLRERDFTINAMAVNINTILEDEDVEIIDLCNGVSDAKKKILRMVNTGIFHEDAIRLLRAVRLSSQYGLSIDENTEKLIQKEANLLLLSSWERVRDEFFAILSCDKGIYYLKKLYQLLLLQEIMPEIRMWENLKDYDVLSHAFKTIEEGEKLTSSIDSFAPEYACDLNDYLCMPIGNIQRIGLFKLALFLHDAGKPATMQREGGRIRFIGHEVEGEIISKRIGRRLKLSRAGVLLVTRLVRNHHRVFNLAYIDKPTARAKAHLFRVMGGSDGLLLLFLALADARATRNGEDPELAFLIKKLIASYYNTYSIARPKPLLNGKEIMEILGISEGVLVGEVLSRLTDAEGDGVVKSRKAAIEFIKRHFNV